MVMTNLSSRAIEVIKAALIQSRKDVIEGRKEFPTFDEQAVLVLTALEAEGIVVVLKADLSRVVEIAGRNEFDPAISRVKAALPQPPRHKEGHIAPVSGSEDAAG